ncbi:MAG: BCCT family transporter [Pseudomonadales bacterium]
MPAIEQTPSVEDGPSIDPRVFLPSLIIVLIAGVYLVLAPDHAEAGASAWKTWVTVHFGWLFLLIATATLGFCGWLAFGRYRNITLGDPGERPEFRELSWAAMMFTAGIGIGLVSWAFVEPVYYLTTPPMGIEAGTAAAMEWGHAYAQFHWGVIPWAFYALATVPIAYSLYVRKTPFLRISVASEGVLTTPRRRQWWSPLIDTLVIIGIIGGAGTSLGLGVPLVAEFFGALTGIESDMTLNLAVLAVWTVIFGTSVYRGLKSGIRRLADVNIVLAVVVVLFVLLAGPTVFILSLSVNSVGLMLNNFVHMSFWLDPIEQGGFPEDWTIFYWAWWIAYAPLMGLFFGRISRGRTIRRVVLGIIGWGSLGTLSFMAVCGAYTLHLELEGLLPVTQVLQDRGHEAAVVAIVSTLPFATIAIAVFTVLSFIFLATTLDSVAYVLASITMRNLHGDVEPMRMNRLCWAFALAFIAVGLLLAGGLDTVKASSVVTALPLIPVLGILALSLIRWLRATDAID